MRDLLSEAIFTVTIVRTLTTIYLFARCREGERSRIILAIISLFTIFSLCFPLFDRHSWTASNAGGINAYAFNSLIHDHILYNISY